ncbi:pentapeptide repeat-containing protein [Spirosoma agri]|uniref:Pentapeptide repeat-containing protein n=1 Tax=Spirosoma agri TaxID=1987381 RepID=A0A6M0IEC0_9BACT|nr:pentapeptide repeat-containing protein [Spirosoma agri]NEU66115.1 pentapeptide repeat-containing protein [Spirosoma agri]
MDLFNQLVDPTTGTPDQWPYQLFEQCTFKDLNLSKAIVASANFINCRFEDCDLSMIVLEGTKLDDVVFVRCKLTSVNFGLCSAFGFHIDFQECQLDYTSFSNRNLKKTRFVDCSMREARFISCDLSGAAFKNCNLELALFSANTLAQVDFSSSYNLELDPDANKLKKTKFSLHSLPGLLTKYDIVVK